MQPWNPLISKKRHDTGFVTSVSFSDWDGKEEGFIYQKGRSSWCSSRSGLEPVVYQSVTVSDHVQDVQEEIDEIKIEVQRAKDGDLLDDLGSLILVSG